jgi:MinD-like ATPase involved in chromosome partitioning or flagellar assembly
MVSKVRPSGIALLSGSGGTGRTYAAFGLAGHIAQCNRKALVLDYNFGWGGLNLTSLELPPYELLLEGDEDTPIITTSHGFDVLTCQPPQVLSPSTDDLKKIIYLTAKVGNNYDYMIFDPPSGGHPLALLAAGLSEKVFLFACSDDVSIRSSCCLLKSLQAEGLMEKVSVIFSTADSPDAKQSLKSRFDAVARQYLGDIFMTNGVTSSDQVSLSSEIPDPGCVGDVIEFDFRRNRMGI